MLKNNKKKDGKKPVANTGWKQKIWYEEDGVTVLSKSSAENLLDVHDVLGTFMDLVAVLGTDDDKTAAIVFSHIQDHVSNWMRDDHGNYHCNIPLADGGLSRTMFCAHLDTVHTRNVISPKHVFAISRGAFVVGTDMTSILGADDRAGCALNIWMIQNGVPGHYVFFTDEEIGRIGSEAYVAKAEIEGQFDRAIQFDRRGYNSVITHQMVEETASKEFATELARQLNSRVFEDAAGDQQCFIFEPDDGGSFTDTYSLRGVIPECTNIGTGYFNAHGKDENQDLDFLMDLADTIIDIDWESLPTVRVPEIEDWYAKYQGKSFSKGDDSYGMSDWYRSQSHVDSLREFYPGDDGIEEAVNNMSLGDS